MDMQHERLDQARAMALEVYPNESDASEFLTRGHMMLQGRAPADVARESDAGLEKVKRILGRLQHGSAS